MEFEPDKNVFVKYKIDNYMYRWAKKRQKLLPEIPLSRYLANSIFQKAYPHAVSILGHGCDFMLGGRHIIVNVVKCKDRPYLYDHLMIDPFTYEDVKEVLVVIYLDLKKDVGWLAGYINKKDLSLKIVKREIGYTRLWPKKFVYESPAYELLVRELNHFKTKNKPRKKYDRINIRQH